MVETQRLALRSLLDDTTPDLGRLGDIQCKHFFSGAAAYVDGHIFISLTKVGLGLKLNPADCAVLLEQGGEPLQYFPDAPVKKDYVLIPETRRDDPEALAPWIQASVDFCKTQPLPRNRKPRTPRKSVPRKNTAI
jgi:TfoX/Sxy family transcriptional regulator of competence genes